MIKYLDELVLSNWKNAENYNFIYGINYHDTPLQYVNLSIYNAIVQKVITL